jgi:hypothetical protein
VVYKTNKRKIINDPVYGFISIPGDIIYDIIEHPWFQRLRNIKQWALRALYPGAFTRFCIAWAPFTEDTPQGLKQEITRDKATLTAILLHIVTPVFTLLKIR